MKSNKKNPLIIYIIYIIFFVISIYSSIATVWIIMRTAVVASILVLVTNCKFKCYRIDHTFIPDSNSVAVFN